MDESLFLQESNSKSFVYFTGEFSCQETYPSGAALKLSYIPRPGQQFYLDLLSLPYDTPSCPVDVFINLDADKSMSGLSFYTTCIELSFNGLYFTNLAHRFYVPMSSRAMCTTSSQFRETFGSEEQFGLIIHSSLYPETLSELTIGQQRFDLLRGEDDFVASFGFYKETEAKVFLLHNVRINIFGGSLLSPVVVNDNMLTFSGVYNLFSQSVYEASVTGQSDIGSTDTWDNLNIALRGWFTAEQSLVSMIEDAVRNRIVIEANEAERRKNESVSVLLGVTARLELNLQKLNESEEYYNETLKTYRIALEKRTEADVNLSLAIDIVRNATDKLRDAERAIDDLCAIEDCPLECVPTTMSRTVFEDIFVNVTGTCDSVCYDTSRQRIPPYQEIRTGWRFTEVCRDNPVVCGTGICNERRCSFLCLSFIERKPVFNYGYVTVARQCMIPCIIQELNRTIEKQETYTAPCGKMVPNQDCETRNSICQKQRNQAFGLIDERQEGLTEPLRQRSQAQATYSNAVNEVIKAEIEKDRAERHLQSAQLQYEVLLRLKTVAESNNEIIIESVKDGLRFSSLLQNFTLAGVVQIHNITFNVVDSQEPTEFPLSITFSTPHNSKFFDIVVSYNFEASFNTQVDYITNEIMDSLLSFEATRQKRSLNRARRNEPEESDYGQEQFEIRCSELTSSYKFVQYIQESLVNVNSSKEDLILSIIDSIEQLNGTDNISDSFSVNYTSLMMLFNITQEDIDDNSANSSVNIIDLSVQRIIIDDLISDALNTLSTIEPDLLQQWQLDLEILAANTSIAERNCYGLTDCILVLEAVLEDLIYFGPDTSLISQLQLAIASLRIVASDNTLTIDNAFDLIVPAFDVVDSMVNNGYWCAKPPIIITHPVSEVNVSVDGTLYLRCEGQSTLPVTYRWTKNGVPIPGATANSFTLRNIKTSDEANYTCEITNDVSTVQTTDANVLVYELPIFYLTPVPVVTYAGASSGAWFACNATSRPDPGWRWYHRTTMDSPWEVIDGEETNELLIEQPSTREEGFYMCMAYNYHGNITSDQVSLRLLKVSVRSSSYPVQFTLQVSDSSSKRKRESLADTNLATELSTFFNTSSVIISNVRTEYAVNETVLTIHFELVSEEVLFANQSLEDIVSNVFDRQNDLEAAKEELEQYFENNEISLVVNGQVYVADESSLSFETLNILCPSGQEITSNYLLCTDCLEGEQQTTMLESRLSNGRTIIETVPRCTLCPLNTYQDKLGGDECIPCPENTFTFSTGSQSLDDCIALCSPGTYSPSGYEPCNDCPYNHYQPEYGASECIECSGDTDNEACPIESISVSQTNTFIKGTSVNMSMSPTLDISSKEEKSNQIAVIVSVVLLVIAMIVASGVIVVIVFVVWKKRTVKSKQHTQVDTSNVYEEEMKKENLYVDNTNPLFQLKDDSPITADDARKDAEQTL